MSDDNENEQPLNLDIPDHLEYSEEHAWVDRSVDPAIIGITEYAADQLGELVFVVPILLYWNCYFESENGGNPCIAMESSACWRWCCRCAA